MVKTRFARFEILRQCSQLTEDVGRAVNDFLQMLEDNDESPVIHRQMFIGYLENCKIGVTRARVYRLGEDPHTELDSAVDRVLLSGRNQGILDWKGNGIYEVKTLVVS